MAHHAITPTLDWLEDQLADLKAWRLSLGEVFTPASGLAEQIARHESWLASQLAALGAADAH